MRRASLIALAALLATASRAYAFPATPDGRQAAHDELARFEAGLDAVDSATLALGRWCATRRLADPPVIRAINAVAAPPTTPAWVRQALRPDPGEPIAYRHVRLVCGDRVLSNAENWYRPRRLTAAMNDALEHTQAPFGAVVKPLGFTRRTLSVTWLFDPLKAAATAGHADLAVPEAVLNHRAVLRAADGAAFSAVSETYTREILGAGPAPTGP